MVEAETGEKPRTRRVNHHKHGRRKLPENLPRVEVIHDLTDEQKDRLAEIASRTPVSRTLQAGVSIDTTLS